jgi:hypothetical protein
MPVLANNTSRVIQVQASSVVKVICCSDDEKIKVYATKRRSNFPFSQVS